MHNVLIAEGITEDTTGLYLDLEGSTVFFWQCYNYLF